MCLWVLLAVLCCQGAAVSQAASTDEGKLNGSASGGGLSKIMPGRWGLVRSTVVNPTQQDTTYRLVWWFDDQPNQQFVRQVWVPARCFRRVSWPVHFDGPVPEKLGVEGRLRLIGMGQDRALAEAQSVVMAMGEKWMTTMISGDNDKPVIGVVAVRKAEDLGKRMNFAVDISHEAPRDVIGWDPTDMVVIARDDLDFDPAQRLAMRRWLAAGGSVWVMLDQMRPGQVNQLLGEDAPVTEVDRLGLTSVQLKPVEQFPASNHKHDSEPVVDEKPMMLVRVIAEATDGWKPIVRVGDWPVLLERAVGQGRLIVSTVDPRTWLDERSASAVKAMGRAIYPTVEEVQPLVPAAVADAFAQEQIGYRIAGRSVIAAVLGAYLLLFMVVGWIARKRGRAESAVSTGLVLAGGAVVVLLVIGYGQRGKVKPTNAMLQLVSAESGSLDVNVRGRMAMFAPYARDASLRSDRGGWAWPIDLGKNTLRRMVWTDMDAWDWQELKVDGGTQLTMRIEARPKLDKSLSLNWSFDDKGLVATVDGSPESQWQDMVLTTDRAICAVTRQQTNGGAATLRVAPDSVLPTGNYVVTGVMTQTQRQRNDVLKAAAKQLRDLPPTLVAWGDLIDDGITDEASVQQRGSSLWTVPMQLTQAPAGQRVVVPWPLVAMEPVGNTPGGRGFSGMVYDFRNRQFLPLAIPTSFNIQFKAPAQVLPLKLEHATLVLGMTAIGRPVSIFALDGRKQAQVAKLSSPDGVRRLDLPVDQLTMRDGAIVLRVQVGDLESKGQSIDSQTAQWSIQQIGLELRGVVGK